MCRIRCRNYLAPAFLSLALCLAFLPANAGGQDPYKKWLDEDVRWIITPQERAEFVKLTTDAQRDQFVEAFWKHRDPTPGTPKNEFKEEHYRRIAYSNEHFAAKTPGWMTDRGRMYILYGPPDKIESHPSPGKTQQGHPYEIWHYRDLPGLGKDVAVKFVDKCNCGDYGREINAAEVP